MTTEVSQSARTAIRRRERFVGGRFESTHSEDQIAVINPATEQSLGWIPDGDEVDVDRAVQSARDAFDHTEWPHLAPADRAEHLRALADELGSRGEELSQLVTSQNGMPISMSRAGHATALAESYRYFADLADSLIIEDLRPNGSAHTLVRREPLGVAGLIVPWNGPQLLTAWKLAPALLAGCTAVIKPSPETTLDAYLLAEAVVAAGLPPGVVNIVAGGRKTGEALVAHRGVDKIAFTGSTEAGRSIAVACAAMLRPVSLELGGKSAALILDDADITGFVPYVASVCSANSGQVCRACTRILAPRSRYEDVVEMVAGAMQAVPIGDPTDPATVFGPLVTARQRERVERYIALGVEEGAEIVVGGRRPTDLPVGYYVAPTVFRNVDNSMRIARQEIFGPVLVVIPYDDDDDAVRIANDSEYGLGGFVYTEDVDRGTAIARRLETGSVGVNQYAMALNSPFGGYKNSGLGRELGPESVDAYRQTKSIYRAGPVGGITRV